MNQRENIYQDEAQVRTAVEAGQHRDIIGGMWDEIGALQFDFLVSRGLAPNHRLLDLGCGAGRFAVKAVPYLNHNRYYGIDLSPSLIAAARREIEAIGCGDKLNRRSLHVTGDFKPSLDMPPFDFVIAQSVFTHLPIAKWGQALDALAGKLASGGKFYATFFVAPYNTPELFHERGGVTTYADRDPFHHHQQGIIDQAIYRCWRVDFIGDWNHPRDQQICELTLMNNG